MKPMMTFLLAASAAVFLAGSATAYTPQIIVVDGTNDFLPANLADADSGDTQHSQLDLGKIYLTNDNSYLYFGMEYNRGTWCDMNLGMAIDTNSVAGGTTDAFGRKIAWNLVPWHPDYTIYDVVPTQCNGFNYEVLYRWNGSSWVTVTDGSNALGIADGTFTEGKLLLSSLGVISGDTLHIEYWVTQEGSTKGPLDAGCSDAVQLSTPSGTTFDVTNPVEMSCMFTYVVLNASDTTPPTVLSASAVGFVTQADKQIATTTTLVDVQFSEPVGTGASSPGNYTVTGAAVSGAAIDGGDASKVHLTLTSVIGPSASFYDVTAIGVRDLANNLIVNNGVGNKASFFLKRLRFEGDMSVFLLTNSTPPDSFAVEGSLSPLTFTLQDNAFLKDPDVDSVYVTNVPLSISKNKTSGLTEATLAWKFSHDADGFEPRGNRTNLISNAGGATDTLRAYWNDDLPSVVTSHPMDVCFRVNALPWNPAPTDTITVTGDQLPLPNFATPGIRLFDNGVGADQTAGDKIYSGYVRFPTGTFKTVNYKFTRNNTYECLGQGNRSVYLNDAVFDTVGGSLGPLPLPARKIDRCTVTDRAIKVIFRVDTDYYFGGPIDSVMLRGNVAPLSFDAGFEMTDGGVNPDAAANDDTFSVAIIFPDSSQFNVEYKYHIDDEYECQGFGNRVVVLDDVNHNIVNPMIPPVGVWDHCADVVGVPEVGDLIPDVTVHLAQNYPNPFGARTTIEFQVERTGRAELVIYDVAGRRVRALLDREVDAGRHLAQWDGRDDRGRESPPGIYFSVVTVNGARDARRMVLVPR